MKRLLPISLIIKKVIWQGCDSEQTFSLHDLRIYSISTIFISIYTQKTTW